MSGAEPFRMRDLLPGAARSAGLDDAAAAAVIWSAWADIAGRSIAKHVRPSSLRQGVLRVHADSPAWATEISYLGDELKARVNERLDRAAVDEVKVWTGPDRPAAGAADRRPPESDPAPTPALRPAPGDPLEAVDRARSAWLARRSRKGPRGGR